MRLNTHFIPAFSVESGASHSVIGKSALKNIDHNFNIAKNINKSKLSFKLGYKIYSSLGTVTFMLSIPSTIKNIQVTFDVAKVNIPPLIGLDILDQNYLRVDDVNKKFASRTQLIDRSTKFYL